MRLFKVTDTTGRTENVVVANDESLRSLFQDKVARIIEDCGEVRVHNVSNDVLNSTIEQALVMLATKYSERVIMPIAHPEAELRIEIPMPRVWIDDHTSVSWYKYKNWGKDE